jgi:hypothetical protein
MFAASKTDSVSGETPDPQFNYVTMLLHGDGTNGSQNNTFLDSSTNNFTITRNGNTTQGSFSPYGSNWSNFFDGSAAFITTSSSAISYASNFTIECWFNTTTTTIYSSIYSDETGSAGGTILLNNGSNNGQITVYLGSTIVDFASTSTNLNNGNWNHVALSRSGSTVRLFINGVLENTMTASGSLTTGGTFRIANSFYSPRLFNGYISNFRVTNTAVYTSSFTPSTTPLTAISGTSLLTCQSNRFIDNSPNNFAITVAGGAPSVQRFNPFGTSTAYSTSVIGGSGYFDGSGDYLNAPNNTAFQIGTGDFTYECWLYPTNLGGSQRLGFVTGSNGGFGFGLWTNTIQYGNTDIANLYSFTASGVINNQWIHFAVSRASGTMNSYVNGVRVDSRSNSTNFSSYDKACIGAYYDGSNGFTGYISDAKFTKGTGVYTGTTLTVPTAPVSAGSCTLLCSMTNGAIFDNAMMNNLETVGNAQISTSVVKYGTGSLYFDGTGDYLTGYGLPNTSVGSGNFTIEGWLNIISSGDWAIVNKVGEYGLYSDANRWVFKINDGPTNVFVINWTPTFNTWYYFACVRNGATTTMYINGVSIGSGTSINCAQTNGSIVVGYVASQGIYLNGYIDDLRITKGFARYTANFTPPTAAFSNTGPY